MRPAADASKVALKGKTLKATQRTVRVRLACVSQAACAGRLTLNKREGKKKTGSLLGRGDFRIAPGRTAAVTLTLSKKGRSAVRIKKRVPAMLIASGPASPRSWRVVLARQR